MRVCGAKRQCGAWAWIVGMALVLGLTFGSTAPAAADGSALSPGGGAGGSGQPSDGTGTAPSATLHTLGDGRYDLYVVVGESMILHARSVKRVAVADPSVADVVVASPREILVNGVSAGRTTLHVWEDVSRSSFTVRVYRDYTEMAREIEERIGAPGLFVWIVDGTVIVEGVVEDAVQRERALKIAGAYAKEVVDLIRVPATDVGEARSEAIAQAIDDPALHVTVLNETVLLEGTVQSELQRTRAETIARAYASDVTNLIQVRSEPVFAPDPSGTLKPDIERAIGDPNVTVRLIGTTVFLEGVVDEEFAKARARAIALAHHDDVVDLLRVAPRGVDFPPEPLSPTGPGAIEAAPVEPDRLGPMQLVVQRVREAIGRDSVQVRAIEQTLFLEGDVTDDFERQRAERIAAAFGHQVVNLLRVSVPMHGEAVVPAIASGGLSIEDGEPEFSGTPVADAGTEAVVEESLAEQIAAALDRPSVRVRAAGGKVILEGTVADQYEKERVLAIAGVYADSVVSFVEVSDPVQVLLQVRVLEVEKRASHQLGFTWGSLDRGVLDPHTHIFAEALIGTPIERMRMIATQIETLVEAGDATILAEPALLTLSGSEANFLAGGEIPIVIPDGSRIVVEWKEYGVRLNMLPVVDSDGRVEVKLTPEVSTLDWANGIRVANLVLPALRTRRVQNVVRVENGETLVIGGLLNNQESRQIEKLPVLGDLPIIGKLFSSERFSDNETELVFLITPYVIRNEDRAALFDLAVPKGLAEAASDL